MIVLSNIGWLLKLGLLFVLSIVDALSVESFPGGLQRLERLHSGA